VGSTIASSSCPSNHVVLPILGGVLIFLGLGLMIATIRLFMRVGKGTLAPWNPTQRLVVQGVYRHVRNPMISGVFFTLLGEAVLLPFLLAFAGGSSTALTIRERRHVSFPKKDHS
jgi:protein-S-isoprenylcysteine O-methyltransferase Ste14